MTAEALEEKVGNIEILLTKVEERAKSNTKRLDEAETRIKENGSLISAIKELSIETKYMREDQLSEVNRYRKTGIDRSGGLGCRYSFEEREGL